MHILSDEFSRQATMESELAIQTSLMSEPKKDIVSLATAQLKFMNLFAAPLFQGVADILPGMQYCVDELVLNKGLFDQSLLEEHERLLPIRSAPSTNETNVPSGPVAPQTASPVPAEDAREPAPVVVEPRHTTEPGLCQQTDSFQIPCPSPKRPADGRLVDGIVTSFPSTTDFGHHDPYDGDSGHHHGHSRQRCSETTEGSSAPNSGDWASQATSATTGRMPLSPSTQGTSIVSRDSFDRPLSYIANIPVPSIPDEPTMLVSKPASTKSHPEYKIDSYPPPLALDEDHRSGGEPVRNGGGGGYFTNGSGVPKKSNGHHNGQDASAERQLKKKPSRFRINGLQSLFRKHKSSSPPMQAADTAG